MTSRARLPYLYIYIYTWPSSSPIESTLCPCSSFLPLFQPFLFLLSFVLTCSSSTTSSPANEIPSLSTSSRRRSSSLRRSFSTLSLDGREFEFDQVNSCNSCTSSSTRTLLMRSFFFEGQVLIIGDFDTSSSSSSSSSFFFVLLFLSQPLPSIEATRNRHRTLSPPLLSKAIFATTTIIDDKYAGMVTNFFPER